jgi:indolepyruvate decarboxylase
MKDILSELTKKVDKKEITTPEREYLYKSEEIEEVKALNTEYFYSRLQEFLKPDDILIAETGIIRFGLPLLKFPKNVCHEDQTLWGSIGWATPAGLGACLAEKDKRVIVITGEGSHQLTVQEISTVMRNGLKPIYIVMNNNGYTIERLLSDNPQDEFNNIASWNYSKLPEVFEGDCFVYRAKTNKDFDEALKCAMSEQENKMCYIEVFLPTLDVPYLCGKCFSKNLIGQTI